MAEKTHFETLNQEIESSRQKISLQTPESSQEVEIKPVVKKTSKVVRKTKINVDKELLVELRTLAKVQNIVVKHEKRQARVIIREEYKTIRDSQTMFQKAERSAAKIRKPLVRKSERKTRDIKKIAEHAFIEECCDDAQEEDVIVKVQPAFIEEPLRESQEDEDVIVKVQPAFIEKVDPVFEEIVMECSEESEVVANDSCGAVYEEIVMECSEEISQEDQEAIDVYMNAIREYTRVEVCGRRDNRKKFIYPDQPVAQEIKERKIFK